MKRKAITILSLVAGALLIATPVSGGTADVSWENTEKYSDISIGSPGAENLGQFQDAIEPYIERLAQNHLPDGTVLVMNIKDVDLAGEFEPWRVNHDVRIVRDIYPPKMKFDYKVLRDGEVIEEGEESLSDIDFNFNIGRRFFDQDQFFYEKEMVNEWIRQDLSEQVS